MTADVSSTYYLLVLHREVLVSGVLFRLAELEQGVSRFFLNTQALLTKVSGAQ